MFEELEGVEQSQDGAVVDGGRNRRRAGRGAAGAALKPRVAVRVEEAAAHRGKQEARMVDAGEDGTEQGEKAAPGVEAFEDAGTVAVGVLLKLAAERRRGVDVVVGRLAVEQETALLGAEEEHEAHHHGKGRLVEFFRFDAAQERPAGQTVRAVEAGDEDLDGVSDLPAERVGDLFGVLEGFVEKRRKGRPRVAAEEAETAEEGKERIERPLFLEPEAGEPGDGAGKGIRRIFRRVHENPLFAVRHETETDVEVATEDDGLFGGGVGPFGSRIASEGVGVGGNADDEEQRLAAVGAVDEGQIRRERTGAADLLHGPGRAGDEFVGEEFETLFEDGAEPVVGRGVDGAAGGVDPILVKTGELPLLVTEDGKLGVAVLLENGDGQEWTGDFDEAKPVVVHGTGRTAHRRHPQTGVSGTRKRTAAGNERARGEA